MKAMKKMQVPSWCGAKAGGHKAMFSEAVTLNVMNMPSLDHAVKLTD